ncbi:MAG: transporter [Planctomycetaceae bacterium]
MEKRIICGLGIWVWLGAALLSAQEIPRLRSLAAESLPAEEGQAEARMFAEEEPEEEEDEIETDRDSFTPSMVTAARRRMIVEAAHSYIDNHHVPDTHSFPELLVRYGVNDWLELRMGWNYEVGGAANPASGSVPGDFEEESHLEAEHRALYGLKAQLTSQEGWRPNSIFILQGYTPTGGVVSKTQMSAGYGLGWKLPNRWSWDSSLRLSTSDEHGDNFNVWSPSTVLKIPIGEKWKIHGEYFGVFSDGREKETVQHYFSPGAHYLIHRDLEIGVRMGWGLNDQSANMFVNSGLGWRY